MTVCWNCPRCGAKNVDLYDETARPACGECDGEYWWEDLLSEEQLEEIRQQPKGGEA